MRFLDVVILCIYMKKILFSKSSNSYIQKNTEFTIQKSTLSEGINNFNKFIIYKSPEKIKIFDRKCDHAGGRLISTNRNKIICPMHKWEFNPDTGLYKNKIKKEEIFYIESENEISFNISSDELNIPDFKTDKKLHINFINHACLMFESEDFKFAIDPWIEGSAFNNGWWLKYKSPKNVYDEINSCDFIFISHTHPDHLHEESLKKIRKDMLIYTMNFSSRSSEEHLKSLGFNNVKLLDHDTGYIDEKKEFYLTPLKSGDFRDDSGFILKYGTFSGLINVDTNYINFYKLPSALTFIASTFASGASGFPLCFDNIELKNKKKVLQLNRNSAKKINENLFQKTNPKYFLPYAGFFVEAADRDSFIRESNIKNSIEDYETIVNKYNLILLNVEKFQKFTFHGEMLKNQNGKFLTLNSNMDTKNVIDSYKEEYSYIEDKFIIDYFRSSNFKNEFNLLIDLTDDYFLTKKQIKIIFNSEGDVDVEFVENITLSDFKNNNNSLQLKIREEAFIDTLKNLKPWEDLLIGFQIRVERDPNVYNTDFWYHFSNIYTKYNAIRIARDCTGCDLLKHSLVTGY
jgi:CMP-N-acetylneuraminate monooxygenase